jgi:hypothetical protein
MRRHLSVDPRLALLLMLTVLGAFAWLTRHPESELVRRAEEWPVVGQLATAFRKAYSVSGPSKEVLDGVQRTDKGDTAQFDVDVEGVDSDRVSARPQVWVEPGSQVQVAPRGGSEVVATVELLGNYSVIERRGDWFHIYRYSVDGGALEGWVLLEGYVEPSPERLHRAEPVLPMAAVAPSADRVERARSFMEGGGIEASCGPYLLYTDAGPETDPCGQLATQLEETYRKRYGLTPVGEPAEAIFWFNTRDAYEGFIADNQRIPADKAGHAAPARGYLALHSEDLPRKAVATTLAHELIHLINRRSLGPALPPWLSEGLADELAESRLEDTGRLVPGELGGYSLVSGNVIQHYGGLVSAARLKEALETSELPTLDELMEMGSEEFHEASQETLLYALSSFWIRFLLSDAPGSDAVGFRAYLEAVASGQDLEPDLLLHYLSGDEQQREAAFRTWLRFQATPIPEVVRAEP